MLRRGSGKILRSIVNGEKFTCASAVLGICRDYSEVDSIGTVQRGFQDTSKKVNNDVYEGNCTRLDGFVTYAASGLSSSPVPGRYLYTGRRLFHDTNPLEKENITSKNEKENHVGSLQASLNPYLQLSRLDKPIGTWLLAWPCFWSIALAAPPGGPLDVKHLILFGVGSVLLRGAGCTINDMWDKDLDRQVERTKSRPLAAGTVTQMQALGWLGLQLSAGLGILLQLNTYSQILGASSLGLVVAYPLMKRITGWPQAFLGLTFNWGALMGWAAVHGSCQWEAVLPLYVSGIMWTLIYDTIYAHQDKMDDQKVGIKSTALTFGDKTKHYLTAFAGINLASMATSGAVIGAGLPFWAGLTAAGLQLGWQITTVDLDNPEDCGNKFKSNWWYGLFMFSGIVADKMI